MLIYSKLQKKNHMITCTNVNDLVNSNNKPYLLISALSAAQSHKLVGVTPHRSYWSFYNNNNKINIYKNVETRDHDIQSIMLKSLSMSYLLNSL